MPRGLRDRAMIPRRGQRRVSVRVFDMAVALAAFAVSCVFSSPAFPQTTSETAAASRQVVYVFWRAGCPYCDRAKGFLQDLERRRPKIRVHAIEVGADEAQMRLFIAMNKAYDIQRPAVPVTVVGRKAFVGYLDDATTGAAIRAAALACMDSGCPDPVAELIRSQQPGSSSATAQSPGTVRPRSADAASPTPIPHTIDLPFVGELAVSSLSLPLLTVVLAAVDGFNPCAMWVLVFLVGLLLGMENHARMWVLGGAFLLTSAAIYYVFMAAWLNALLFLGALIWIRIAVGLLAVGGGAYYLREFVLNADGVCKVTSPDRRRRIIDAMKETVHRKRFALALLGIVGVAVAVNLIELLCSAGIPAVYTKVLALSDLPSWQYYLYLLLYIVVFLLDDLIVFALAMATLQVGQLTTRYSRYSHLVGGVVLTGIGALLLLRPEWLVFA